MGINNTVREGLNNLALLRAPCLTLEINAKTVCTPFLFHPVTWAV